MVRLGIEGLAESQLRGRKTTVGWHRLAERPSKQSLRKRAKSEDFMGAIGGGTPIAVIKALARLTNKEIDPHENIHH